MNVFNSKYFSFFMGRNSLVKRQALLSLFESTISLGIYFFSMKFVIFYSGVEAIGIWSITIGLIAFVRLIDLSGSSGLSRMVASTTDNNERIQYIDTTILFSTILFSVVAMLAYLPMYNFVLSATSPEMADDAALLIILALVSLPVGIASLGLANSLDGIGRSHMRSYVNIGGLITYAGCVGIIVPKYGLVALGYAQLFQYSFVALAARIILSKYINSMSFVPKVFNFLSGKRSVHFGAKVQITAWPLIILDSGSRMFALKVLGMEGLAIFTLAYALSSKSRALLVSALSPFLPKLTAEIKSDNLSAINLHDKISNGFTKISSLFFAVLILFSPMLSLFFFSEIRQDFISFIVVLCFGWWVSAVCAPLQIFGRAMGIFKYAILGQWLTVLLSFTIVMLLQLFFSESNPLIGLAVGISLGSIYQFIGESRIAGSSKKKLIKSNRLVFLFMFVLFLLCQIAVMYGFAE